MNTHHNRPSRKDGDYRQKPGSQLYRVTWTIEIEANTPQMAARLALDTQRDYHSTATVFVVTDEAGNESQIDLL